MTDIDIYDASLRPLGTMDSKEAHKAGQWHRTFHCWVYTEDDVPRILLQVRAPRMRNYPNLLDVSAAGHLDVGESVDEGVREVYEELGIDAEVGTMTYLGERVEVADQENGQRNREYQSVFLLRTGGSLAQFTPDPKEVWGVFWLPIEQGLALFAEEIPHVDVVGVTYDEASSSYVDTNRRIAVEDFLPRIQRYYSAAMIAAERAIDGKRYFAIS